MQTVETVTAAKFGNLLTSECASTWRTQAHNPRLDEGKLELPG